MRNLFRNAVFFLSVLLPLHATAGENYFYPVPFDEGRAPREYLNLFREAGEKLGGREDESPFRREFSSFLDSAMVVAETRSESARRIRLLQAMDYLIKEVKTYRELSSPVSRDNFDSLLEAMKKSQVEIVTGVVEGPMYWRQDDNRYADDTVSFFDLLCQMTQDDPDPERLLKDAQNIVRFAGMTRNAMEELVRPRKEKTLTTVTRLDREWDRYFERARSQYPWEWWLNSCLYSADDDRLNSPPSGQVILMHPSLGYQWVADAGDRDRMHPAVVVDLIGYNRLSWTDGKIANWPLGVSAVATYTGAAGEKWGFGGRLHIRSHFSVGVTHRRADQGDNWAMIASYDLGRLFFEPSERKRLEFREGR